VFLTTSRVKKDKKRKRKDEPDLGKKLKSEADSSVSLSKSKRKDEPDLGKKAKTEEDLSPAIEKDGAEEDDDKQYKNPNGVTRLFIGNLPFTVNDVSLAEHFKPATITHIKWVTDKLTGKFYGSAFLEMANKVDAAKAVAKNGSKLISRELKINYAPARSGDIWPPKAKIVTGGGQAGGVGKKCLSERPDGCVKLFVGNLSYEIDDDAIFKFFGNVDAELKAVRWLHHKESGDFKGCGYVEFWNEEACQKGATLNGKTLMERPIRIDWSD